MKKVMKSMGILLGCGVLFFAACNKEEAAEQAAEKTVQTRSGEALGEFIPKEDGFANMFEENREANTEVYTVNANEPIFVTTEAGVTLELPANALDYPGGGTVEGEVTILFNGLMDAGQMIIQDRATSGINEDGEGVSALESAGEFFIEIQQGGEPLVLNAPLRVTVPTDDINPDMRVFVEAEGTGDDLVWELDEEREIEAGEGEGGFTYGYEILPDLGNQWRGCNIDAFSNCASGAYSDVRVEVPMGYDPTNTEVYMIPCGPIMQIANFDNWDAASNSFLEHGGRTCEGMCVHFVLVTNASGSLEYEIHQSVTINPGSHVEVFNAPFAAISPNALVALINALP